VKEIDDPNTEINFVIETDAVQQLLKYVLEPQENLEDKLDFEILFPSDKQLLWKIVVIGDGAVGKTSIRRRFIGQGFDPVYLSTIGADFSTQILTLGPRTIKFQVWDLAGQPRFKDVRRNFYKGANGALIVYDVTNRQSFKNLENWLSELWKYSKKEPIPFILLGNKSDLEKNGIRSIPDQYAKFFVEKHSKNTRANHGFGINFVKTSAKTGKNIDLAFELLAIQIAVQIRYQKLKS
jgi:Ras-related protein Rab-1A